eukprot:scaffold148_cov371-Prasinococcus_capsulatus_cf.AAC.13
MTATSPRAAKRVQLPHARSALRPGSLERDIYKYASEGEPRRGAARLQRRERGAISRRAPPAPPKQPSRQRGFFGFGRARAAAAAAAAPVGAANPRPALPCAVNAAVQVNAS